MRRTETACDSTTLGYSPQETIEREIKKRWTLRAPSQGAAETTAQPTATPCVVD